MGGTPGISPRKLKGESALLLVTLLWGGTFVIVKLSIEDISSLLFIAVRFSLAALILIPFAIKERHLFTYSSLKGGLVLGFLMFFAFAAQTEGLKYTTATKSGFITGSLVVMVPVFQTLIEKRIPSKGSIIGTVLVFIGILFLSSGGESIFEFFDELGSNFNFGDFLTLICAVLFALHVVYLDLYSKKENYKVLVFYQISLSALLGFLFAFLLAGLNIEPLEIEITGTSFFGIVYTGILATLVTTYLQTRYQKEVSPTKAGIVYSFEPIFAALIAFFVLSEKITNFGFIGSILIVSGLLVSELYDSFGGKRLSEKGSN